jgi:hypothetical protein
MLEAIEDFPPGTEAVDDVSSGHEVVVERQGGEEGRPQPPVESIEDPGGVLGRIAQCHVGPVDHRHESLVIAQQVGGPEVTVHQAGLIAAEMFTCLRKVNRTGITGDSPSLSYTVTRTVPSSLEGMPRHAYAVGVLGLP